MKKLVYLLIVAMMPMCFAACGGDDDNNGGSHEGHDSRLVGTWYDESYSIKSGFIFESNGTCYYSEWGDRETPDWGNARQWETDGQNHIVITKLGNKVIQKKYRYEVNGRNLNIYSKDNDESEEYTFLEWRLIKQ